MLALSNLSNRFSIPVMLGALISSLLLMSYDLTEANGNEHKRPNILFIFTDDHASHAMSCYGSKINQTPNLDRIAREGMIFNNCFCTNSICGPSRAVILTGKHSHLNGFKQNGNKFDGSQQTFPKILRKNGYQTAIVGKWHLATQPTGFDYSEILIGQGPYYNPPMIKNGKRVKHVGYTTDIITDLALDYLKNSRDTDKPFMLMYQHKAPHRNWQPGPKYLHMYDDVTIPEPDNLFDNYEGRGTAAKQQDMTIATTMTPFDLKLTPPRNLTPEQLKVWNAAYEPKNTAFRKAKLTGKDLVRWKYQRYMKDYLRCIASVDENVGRMLDYLEESGLAKNTVVIYSSDQGFYLGDHGWFDKRFMYEESYRMPFVARWPGVIKPGSVNNDLVSNLDFAETFLDIAGARIPEDMQGVSLIPLFKGNEVAWRKSLYYHYYEFYNDRRSAHMVRRHNGVRTKRYKLIDFYNLGEWELYDLEKDPHEMKSVYHDPEYAQVVTDLKAELKRLQKQYQVPDDRGSVQKDPPSLYIKPNPRATGAGQRKKSAPKK
ncbi:sulfatase family protein [Gimesia aquarii]|uniref:Arylsulfatase n=1 Tax=Gimesia aquarii TaxID=2527964 RepID=A0A517W185_9PLAN|nr:sulfatase [Gimesia aquarii]QDT99013.1 Arylsulfatase [Gimesia aquarii]